MLNQTKHAHAGGWSLSSSWEFLQESFRAYLNTKPYTYNLTSLIEDQDVFNNSC